MNDTRRLNEKGLAASFSLSHIPLKSNVRKKDIDVPVGFDVVSLTPLSEKASHLFSHSLKLTKPLKIGLPQSKFHLPTIDFQGIC